MFLMRGRPFVSCCGYFIISRITQYRTDILLRYNSSAAIDASVGNDLEYLRQ